MSRNLRKRSRESVLFQMAPQQKRSIIPNNVHLFNKRLTDVDLIQTSVFKTANGFTTFRIWPTIDPENPNTLMESGLQTIGSTKVLNGLSMSSEVFSAQTGLRVPKDDRKKYRKGIKLGQTNFIYAKTQGGYLEGIPYKNTPFVVLSDAVFHAKNEKTQKTGSGIRWNPEWNTLNVYDEKNNYTPLPRRQPFYYAIVSLYENGKVFDLERKLDSEYDPNLDRYVEVETARHGIPYGEGDNDPLVVLRLPGNLVKDMMLLLECGQKEAQKYKRRQQAAKQDNSIDSPQKPEVTFPYGDPIGVYDKVKKQVNGGLFFHQFNSGITEFDGISIQDSKGYSIGLSNELEGPNGTLTPSLNSSMVKRILAKNLYFTAEEGYEDADDYLLRVAGIEEQCELLVHAFYPVKDIFKYAWANHPEYLQYECVRSVMTNKSNFIPQSNSSEDSDNYSDEPEEVDTEPLKSRTSFEVEDEVDTDDLLAEVEQEEMEEPVTQVKKKVGKSMLAAPKKSKKSEDLNEDFSHLGNELDETKSDDFDDESDDFEDEDDDFDDDDDYNDEDFEDDDDDDFDDDDDDEMEAKLNKSLAKAKAVDQQPRKRFRK